jgi:hypothetical protein
MQILSTDHHIGVHVRAPYDTNGNSRAGWLIYRLAMTGNLATVPGRFFQGIDTSTLVGFIADDGRGLASLEDLRGMVHILPTTINVSASEYRTYVREQSKR